MPPQPIQSWNIGWAQKAASCAPRSRDANTHPRLLHMQNGCATSSAQSGAPDTHFGPGFKPVARRRPLSIIISQSAINNDRGATLEMKAMKHLLSGVALAALLAITLP